MAPKIITRGDAKAQGLKRWYSGVPCKRDHLSERFVSDGQCVSCIYEKNASWAKRNPDKKRESARKWIAANAEHSKASRKAYHSKWYEANRDKKLAQNAAYLNAHPEINRAAALKWRNKNLDRARASASKWATENPDKRRALSKRKYAARPDHYRAKNNEWARKNPEKKAVVTHRRRARKRNAAGTHTPADLRVILTAQNHRCAYCRADLRKVKRHVDHIEPLALGGSNDKTNLQYLCAQCNLQKGAKDPLTFAQELGYLL